MNHDLSRLPPRPILQTEIKNDSDQSFVDYVLAQTAFQQCTSYREECHLLHNYQFIFHFSNRRVARLLGIDHKSYEKQIFLPLEFNSPGRPTILSEESSSLIVEEILRLHSLHIYPTLRDIQQFIAEKIEKSISISTIYRFIDHSDKFKTVTGQPMEAARCEIPPEAIDDYFSRLTDAITGVPVSLIFNADEAGEDDYVDLHSYKVIVDKAHPSPTIPIPVRRESKRSTLLHCICADGTSLKPLLIIPRKTLDSDSILRVCSSNVLIQYQKKGFANTDLIKTWLEEVFFPEVERKLKIEQERTGYSGDAVLILDGFSCHHKALECYDLASRHIKLVYLAPHSSHLTQPLDLVIFALQKRVTTQRLCRQSFGQQTDSIRRIIQGLQTASTTENIVAAFESAGIMRTFSRNTVTHFNGYMPTAKVERRIARFFKDPSYVQYRDHWRIEI